MTSLPHLVINIMYSCELTARLALTVFIVVFRKHTAMFDMLMYTDSVHQGVVIESLGCIVFS